VTLHRTRIGAAIAIAVTCLIGCRSGSSSTREDPAAALAAVRAAHDAYVAAINTNKLDRWLAALSDEVVYLVPSRAAIVGKKAAGEWAAAYLAENTTHWTKTVDDFVVSGDWAIGRYAYAVSDTVVIRDPEVEGGGTANDSGWGLIVYHRDADGAWRVARDAWGSDRPAR
jgi:ketosteroid isomerase-like protein